MELSERTLIFDSMAEMAKYHKDRDYRCAHAGCRKNWFPRGRPYCGEHAKLHGKAKSRK